MARGSQHIGKSILRGKPWRSRRRHQFGGWLHFTFPRCSFLFGARALFLSRFDGLSINMQQQNKTIPRGTLRLLSFLRATSQRRHTWMSSAVTPRVPRKRRRLKERWRRARGDRCSLAQGTRLINGVHHSSAGRRAAMMRAASGRRGSLLEARRAEKRWRRA